MGITLSRRRAIAGVAVAAAAALGSDRLRRRAPRAPSGEAGATTLHLVGFAVPAEANKAIQAKWAETEDGKGVVWEQSYGASGDQSRAVANGLKADYVNFSLEGDVNAAGRRRPGRRGLEVRTDQGHRVRLGGGPRRSRGKPEEHPGLGRPDQAGVRIVTPNPASSGSARWNILAAYHQAVVAGGSEADAKDVPDRVLRQRGRPARAAAGTPPTRSCRARPTC